MTGPGILSAGTGLSGEKRKYTVRCRASRAPDEGAAAVEFALVLVLFLTLVFGIIQYGFFFFQSQSVSSTAREASRLAAVGVGSCTAWESSVIAASRSNGLGSAQLPDASRVALRFESATGVAGPAATGANAVVTLTWTPTNFSFPFLPFISGNQNNTSQTRVESAVSTGPLTC